MPWWKVVTETHTGLCAFSLWLGTTRPLPVKYKLSAKHTEGGNSISSNTCETPNKPLFPPPCLNGTPKCFSINNNRFYFKKKIEFINLCIFGCAGSSLLYAQAFSSCGKQGLLSSCSAWASHWGGFSCCGARVLGHTGSRILAEWPVLGLSCSLVCGIFLDLGSNLCPLHWQPVS